MADTHFQRQDVAHHYLTQVRGGIPYGADQVLVMLQLIKHFTPNPRRIMDLGCGNGFLAEIVLRTYPQAHAILLDHSEAMLEQAREHVKEYMDRCQIVLGDLEDPILQYAEPGSIDCVVSGFAIHHLPHPRKKALYQEIYELLTPGGILVNIEHVASATAKLEQLYDELFIDHLALYHQRERGEVAREYALRPDKADNILERVEVQVEWLKEMGYRHADCYFKWMELAVFGGVK